MLGVFEKSERIRHIGHLDIQRSVQRGLRRSNLPVAYSNGFNPHILITFASALSTGACGRREIMDVTMAEDVSENEFLERMNKAMPPELHLIEARALDQKHPSLMGMLRAARYDLKIYDAAEAEQLIGAIPAMMQREQVFAMRKTKTAVKQTDIRPLIYTLCGIGNHIDTTLALTETETCKPGMLMEALKHEAGFPADEEIRMLITRTLLLGENEEGILTPLEQL
jgi:radical SAM-linked protein